MHVSNIQHYVVFLSFSLEISLSSINLFNSNGGTGDVMVKPIALKTLSGLAPFTTILTRAIAETKLVFVSIILCST